MRDISDQRELGRAMMCAALPLISIRSCLQINIRLTLREKTSRQYSNSRKEKCTC